MGGIGKPDCIIAPACTFAWNNTLRFQVVRKIHDLADTFPAISSVWPKDRNYIGTCKFASDPLAATSNPLAAS